MTAVQRPKIGYLSYLLKVLIRDESNTLLEVEAKEAPGRLQADLSVLQILLHAQHEGVLTFGDIDLVWLKNLRILIYHLRED